MPEHKFYPELVTSGGVSPPSAWVSVMGGGASKFVDTGGSTSAQFRRFASYVEHRGVLAVTSGGLLPGDVLYRLAPINRPTGDARRMIAVTDTGAVVALEIPSTGFVTAVTGDPSATKLYLDSIRYDYR